MVRESAEAPWLKKRGFFRKWSKHGVVCDNLSPVYGLLSKAKEAQDDLVKTKEELHLVMTAPPPPPPPVYEPVSYHVQDNLQDEGTEYTGYSAELSSEGILDDRNEEKRITEAEKNERVQRQLMVRAGAARRHVDSGGGRGRPTRLPAARSHS